jgi:amino acid adenylation domain-containing protein
MVILNVESGASQFDLSLIVSKLEGQYQLKAEYNSDLFTAVTISRMFRSYIRMLEHVVVQPACPISRLPIMNGEEIKHLVVGLNQTQQNFPREKCVHHLFEEQVNRTPGNVAIIFNDISLTYSCLNRRANRLAHTLQALEIGQESRVGVFMERSLELLEVLLAILKTGATYVPIHPGTPSERLEFIVKDAGIKLLLTNFIPYPFSNISTNVVDVSKMKFTNDDNLPNLENIREPGKLAYIIYTSGSTGQPKGVMIFQAALVNFLYSMRRRPGIQSADILLSVTSISFDIAALELFLPLIVGATIILAGIEMIANPSLLAEAIDLKKVSMVQATPATWQLLLDSGWKGKPGLKALCGGDALGRILADRLLEKVGSLWNMYGPTETTIWSSVGEVFKEIHPITIGQPVSNTQLYILDRYLQLVAIGVIGELHIGGEGLAMGYLNHPELTTQKFIPDLFNSKKGERLFKTGDQARYLPDGSIEVLGRVDDQVKIDGHRIELGEVAAVLMQHPQVQNAVATTSTENPGTKKLVAYYVTGKVQPVTNCELRDFVRTKLPGYMVPAVFVNMDNFPLTTNGKINRKALPAPEATRSLPGYVAPRNETEEVLAGIWQAILEIEQVGIHDNFFDLGGASIQSIQIIAQANMAGLELSAETIFEYQTIAGLAEQINKLEDSAKRPFA